MIKQKRSRPARLFQRPGVMAALLLLAVLTASMLTQSSLKTAHAATRSPLEQGHVVYITPENVNVQQFAWSPDSQRLATITPQGQVTIQDATTGDHAINISLDPPPFNTTRALSWSPDGAFLLAETTQIYLINPVTGAIVKSYPAPVFSFASKASGTPPLAGGFAPPASESAWSPSGDLLATVLDEGVNVAIWNPLTGSKLSILQDKLGHPLRNVSWSADGNYIAAVNDFDEVQIWEAHTGVRFFEISGMVRAVWAPRGPYIAFGFSGFVEIWDLSLRQQVASFASQGTLSWSPDGTKLVANDTFDENGNLELSATIWAFKAGTKLFTFPDPLGQFINGLAWSPDGKYIASSSITFDGSNTRVAVWTAS